MLYCIKKTTMESKENKKRTRDWFYKNPIIFLTQHVYKYSKENRGKLIFSYMLFVIAICTISLSPVLTGMIMNVVQDQGVSWETLPTLSWLCFGYLLLTIFQMCCHIPARVMERENAFLSSIAYQQYLIEGIVQLPLEWHAEHHSGDTIDRINKGSSSLFQHAQNSFTLIEVIVSFLVSVIVLLIFSPNSYWIILMTMMVVGTANNYFDKILQKQNKQINETENKASECVFDAISNITSIVILRMQAWASKKIYTTQMASYDVFVSSCKTNEFKWCVSSICASFVTCSITIWYFYISVRNGTQVLVGTVSILMGYATRVNNCLFSFTDIYGSLLNDATRLENSDELTLFFPYPHPHPRNPTDTKPSSVRRQSLARLAKKQLNYSTFSTHNDSAESISIRIPISSKRVQSMIQGDWKQISIHNMNFSYPKPILNEHTPSSKKPQLSNSSRSMMHLQNISFHIKKGEKIALVGESGSGKSTCLKLLRGLYLPQSCQIELDGQSIDQLSDLEATISLIPQDPEIFATTIRENITMGITIRDRELTKYIDMSCFSNIIKNLPRGLDSNIKEKGVNLSGGEKQRLALARGLLSADQSSTQILLLDEPTSSVDVKNEQEIYDNIFKHWSNISIVSAIHKLHLLPMFDTILFFEQGRIVAQGIFAFY